MNYCVTQTRGHCEKRYIYGENKKSHSHLGLMGVEWAEHTEFSNSGDL